MNTIYSLLILLSIIIVPCYIARRIYKKGNNAVVFEYDPAHEYNYERF